MIGGGNLQEAGWGKSEKIFAGSGADRGCDVPLSANCSSMYCYITENGQICQMAKDCAPNE